MAKNSDTPSSHEINLQELTYFVDNSLPFRALLAIPSYSEQKKPAILIAHDWRGRNHFAVEKAKMVARLGYIGFAADLYGDGKIATDNNEAFSLMQPLFLDRKTLRTRITAAYDALSQIPQVEPNSIGAIGFCFGGCCMLELLRSGKELKGVVSFHGLLGYRLGEENATPYPWDTKQQLSKALFLHGHKDPLVSSDEILTLQKELEEHHIDWQMHIYGQAAHAFTNPEAHGETEGLQYNALSERRALTSMQHFFEEVFS